MLTTQMLHRLLHLMPLALHWLLQYARNFLRFLWGWAGFVLTYCIFHQNTNGLELVPQPTYSHGKVPVSTSDAQTAAEWDLLIHHQSGGVAKNLEPDDMGRFSPLARRWAWSNGDCFCELNTNYNHLHLVGSKFILLLCWCLEGHLCMNIIQNHHTHTYIYGKILKYSLSLPKIWFHPSVFSNSEMVL